MARLKSARFSRVLPAASFLAALLAVAPVWAGESAAPVTVTYGISIAHVPIGTAKFTETLKDQTFHLHLGAEFSGLVRMFFAPDLSADSEGSVVNERIVPKHYQMLVNHPDDPQKVSMSLVGGTVVSAELQPPLTVRASTNCSFMFVGHALKRFSETENSTSMYSDSGSPAATMRSAISLSLNPS